MTVSHSSLESESWPRGVSGLVVSSPLPIIFHPGHFLPQNVLTLDPLLGDAQRIGSRERAEIGSGWATGGDSISPRHRQCCFNNFFENLIKNCCYFCRDLFFVLCVWVSFSFLFYCFNHFYFVRLPCHLLWLLPWSQGVQRSEESSRGPSEPFWFFSSDCVVFICFLCSSEQCFKFELITWQGSGIGFRGTRILAYNNTNHNLSIGYDALPIRKRG